MKSKIVMFFAIILLILGVIGLVFFLNKEILQHKEIPQNKEMSQNELVSISDSINIEKEEIIEQLGGYKVIGKIIIDKINLKDVILEKTTDESLNYGITKFWGPNINEPGNFSITGHNYKIKRSNLFKDLDKLEVNDTFILEDLENNKVTYKIYDKSVVPPTDTSGIDQNNDGKREATLITCTKGAVNRIVFKAREI